MSKDADAFLKRFDTTGDGKISIAELTDALNSLGGTSADEVNMLMSELDTDGDGFVDYEELVAFVEANPGLMKDVSKVF